MGTAIKLETYSKSFSKMEKAWILRSWEAGFGQKMYDPKARARVGITVSLWIIGSQAMKFPEICSARACFVTYSSSGIKGRPISPLMLNKSSFCEFIGIDIEWLLLEDDAEVARTGDSEGGDPF